MFEVDEDQVPEIKLESREKEDDALYCARCGHLVTRVRWAYRPGGGREHVFNNPAGRTYRIVCFLEAPGASDHGDPTEEYTWFPGYAWTFALCQGCSEHIGWLYQSDLDPPLFWGLIKDKLTSQPK